MFLFFLQKNQNSTNLYLYPKSNSFSASLPGKPHHEFVEIFHCTKNTFTYILCKHSKYCTFIFLPFFKMILYIAQDTIYYFISIWCTYVVVIQSLSRVPLFATPRTVALRASLIFTISWSLLRLMAIESVMPFNHFNLCHPLLLLPPVFPNIRVISSESVLCISWTKY